MRSVLKIPKPFSSPAQSAVLVSITTYWVLAALANRLAIAINTAITAVVRPIAFCCFSRAISSSWMTSCFCIMTN